MQHLDLGIFCRSSLDPLQLCQAGWELGGRTFSGPTEMFYVVLVGVLAHGHSVDPKPLLCYHGCEFRVVVLLKLNLQSRLRSWALVQVLIEDIICVLLWSGFLPLSQYFIWFFYKLRAAFMCPSLRRSFCLTQSCLWDLQEALLTSGFVF